MKAAALRSRNKTYYRVLHVPIWIWVFFSLPGALTAHMYLRGFDRRDAVWLALVTAVCAWRGSLGRLPGAESRPYITHYGLSWPNLPYRVICYTAGWIAILVPWLLNCIGLVYAVLSGEWILTRLYGLPYDVLALVVVALAALDRLPRTRRTITDEGADRAWFYVGVWTVVPAQAAALAMWRLGPALGFHGAALFHARLTVFLAMTAVFLAGGLTGRLPRCARYYWQAGGGGELRAAEGE